MTKKTMRLISFLVIVLTIISCVGMVLAKTPSELNATESNTDSVYSVGEKVMGIIQAAGVVIAVVVLMVLGIKFMMGSAEEKAEYKKTFIPYIIGAILIFAASTLANVVYNFAGGLK